MMRIFRTKQVACMLMAVVLLCTAALASADGLRMGNDRFGYLTGSDDWTVFKSINITDEQLAQAEQEIAFAQYANMPLGFVIMTMVVYEVAETYKDAP